RWIWRSTWSNNELSPAEKATRVLAFGTRIEGAAKGPGQEPVQFRVQKAARIETIVGIDHDQPAARLTRAFHAFRPRQPGQVTDRHLVQNPMPHAPTVEIPVGEQPEHLLRTDRVADNVIAQPFRAHEAFGGRLRFDIIAWF